MKLLFVSQYFDPEIFRGNDVAYYLASHGVDVTVVTGTPNYPQGKFHKGYGWLKRTHEHKNGLRIIRVPIIARGHNKITLALNYLSYAFHASLYMLPHLLRHKYDACFVQQLSPVFMSMPGIMFKKLKRKPLYLWVLDIWPESLEAAGGINNKHLLRLCRRYARTQYRVADVILTSSERFRDSIEAIGDFGHKIKYFPQWADTQDHADDGGEIPRLPDKFNIVYAGNIGESQDFESIIEAAKLLKDEPDAHIAIFGGGRKEQWVREQIDTHSLRDVITLYGHYPSSRVARILAQSDALLVSLKDNPVFDLTVPAKVQTYMASGKPIIGMIGKAGRELIQKARCGIAVETQSPDLLAEAIRRLRDLDKESLKRYGDNGKRYYDQHFDREKLLAQLSRLLIEDKDYGN